MELCNFQSSFRHIISYHPIIALWCIYNASLRWENRFKGENDFEVTKVLESNLPSGLIQSNDNVSIMEGIVCLWVFDVWVYICVHIPVGECRCTCTTAPMWRSDGNLTTSNVSPHIPPCLRQGLLVFCCLGQVCGLMSSWDSRFCLPSPGRSVLGSQMFFVCIQFLCRF